MYFFYERSLFLKYRLIINISTILILDSILFLLLFIICSTRDMKVDVKSGKISTDECSTSKDIVRSTLLMLLILVSLSIIYDVLIMIGLNVTVKTGIITTCSILGIILIHYSIHYIK